MFLQRLECLDVCVRPEVSESEMIDDKKLLLVSTDCKQLMNVDFKVIRSPLQTDPKGLI